MFSRKTTLLFVSLTSLLTLASCITNESNKNIVVENNSEALSSRVIYTNKVIEIVDNSNNNKPTQAPKKEDALLTLIAEVDPPSYEGTTLQATEVIIKGNKAYVSYNVAGETMLGAIEVFNITKEDNPELESSVILTDTDVNGITVHGNDLYFAGASSTLHAMLARMKMNAGKLTDEITIIDLPGFAGTDVDVSGNFVYATSGDNAGVSILNKSDLSLFSYHVVDDARGVDVDNDGVVVVYGTDAGIITFDQNSGVLQNDFPLNGATISESKSTVEVKKGKAILALGDGGTQIVCTTTGEVIDSIPVPIVIGLDASKAITNSATAYKTALFMSNGEAGAYIALAENSFSNNNCDVENLTMLGKLQLEDEQSVNHILFRNNTLFVASGTGGLKILEVSLTTTEEDDDDE